ncbi:MAG TPA: YfhO family protein [Bacteroidales bacterium]|nr:YfhO family protein [Bacteroidales bacterium]
MKKKFQNRLNEVLKFRYFPQILLLLLLIIGYWPLSTFHYSMKYDMIDCYYPWRYMVSECLQNGLLPWWNPYQTLGYPIHADPQSGAWYPFVWIIGSIWGYDIYSLEFEFLLHVFMAGTGMFMLGRTLLLTKGTSLWIAASYMFSGFIIGNAQHFTWIISAAWVPYIISYFLKYTYSQKYIHALIAGFFMFLLISGGYPAFTVILSYFLLLLFVYFLITYFKQKGKNKLVQYIKLNAIFLLSVLLFSAVVLFSVFEISSFITRGAKLPLDMALFCPLSPQCLISFIIPFAVVKELSFFSTDLSMTNIYFGLLGFIFFIFSIFIKKTSLIKIFFWWGVFCLLAALGEYTPVRKILYDYFPMMGFFRFPSLFRLFVIISFLIVAGYSFDYYIKLSENKQKKIVFIIFPIILILIIAVIFSRMQDYLSMIKFIQQGLFKSSEQSTIWQHIAFQSIVQVVILIFTIFTIFKVKDSFLKKRIIILITCIDLLIASRVNEPYTTYSTLYTAAYTKKISCDFPEHFPLPSSKQVLMNNDNAGYSKGTFWKNLNTFYKEIAWDGFAPIKFKGYEYLLDSMPKLFDVFLANPPVFLSNNIFPEDSMKPHLNRNNLNHKNVYLSSDDYNQLNNTDSRLNEKDTVYITSFNPNYIKMNVVSRETQILALLQNYYTGWTVTINNKSANIMQYNKGFMCTQIPTGRSDVEFRYFNSKIFFALGVSIISLIAFFIILFIKRKTI